MYDSTSNESFESLQFWVDELKEQTDGTVIKCVVASKTDWSEAEEVTVKQASDYSKSVGASFF